MYFIYKANQATATMQNQLKRKPTSSFLKKKKRKKKITKKITMHKKYE